MIPFLGTTLGAACVFFLKNALGTNVQKALLGALLELPTLKEMQNKGNFTKLMVVSEEVKTLPFGEVWNEYCRQCGKPLDGEWYNIVEDYEKEELLKR